MSSTRRDLLTLYCFASVFIMIAGGRVASSDAGQTLQASTLLVLTGSPGTSHPPDWQDGRTGWVRAPNGRFYQAHDVGNLLLMAPAAWLGTRFSDGADAAAIARPPILSRFAVSMSTAVLAAIGCLWMAKLLALWCSWRRACAWTMVFAAGTPFLAYVGTGWDVLGAACGVCGVLLYSARTLASRASRGDLIGLGVTVALACSFRFSLTPFLLPAAAAVAWMARAPWSAMMAGAACGLGMAPALAYNSLRTGSMFVPGVAAPEYLSGVNRLGADVLSGLAGLLFMPNKSLFVFAPVLAAIIALPWLWRRLDGTLRRLLTVYGLAAGAYTVLIASVASWGSFGWGPRHLLPIVPILFLAAVSVLWIHWQRWRAPLALLLGISVLLGTVPAVTNWSLATAVFQAYDPHAATPDQHIAVWRTLALGLRGVSLPSPPDATGDSLREATARFPDLWLARLIEHSTKGAVAGAAILVFLLGTVATVGRRVLSWQEACPPPLSVVAAGPSGKGG